MGSTLESSTEGGLDRGIGAGAKHECDACYEQGDRPAGEIAEEVLLQADDADSEEEQTCSEEVLHLIGNAAEDKCAGNNRKQELEDSRFMLHGDLGV